MTPNVRAMRNDDAEDDPESERLPAERLVDILAHLAGNVLEHRDAPRRRGSTPSAPRTSSPLTSRPRTRLRETPPSKTTASVFCIEFITPVAPQSASPRVTSPARLQGDGTEVISVSSLRSLRREVELVARSQRRDPAGRRGSTTASGRGSSRRTSREERARRARGRRSPPRTASRRDGRRGRAPHGRGRRARRREDWDPGNVATVASSEGVMLAHTFFRSYVRAVRDTLVAPPRRGDTNPRGRNSVTSYRRDGNSATLTRRSRTSTTRARSGDGSSPSFSGRSSSCSLPRAAA